MKKESLKTKIYKEVLQSVVKGEYPPEGVISESMLIERFNVSKSPVRDALVQLCSEGVLKSMPRYGYVVVKLTGEDIKDIIDYRKILECGMLTRVIENITDSNIKELAQIDDLCTSEEAKEDFWVHWEHNMNFHKLLISFAHNEFAYKNLEGAMRTLTRAYGQYHWNKWNDAASLADTKCHANIIEALKNRDEKEAVKWLEKDLSDFGI